MKLNFCIFSFFDDKYHIIYNIGTKNIFYILHCYIKSNLTSILNRLSNVLIMKP